MINNLFFLKSKTNKRSKNVKNFLFIVIFSVLAYANCPVSKKISCAAAMVGCGTVCACDIPVCECCPGCLACVSTADCCDCLFPNWSGCTEDSKMFNNQTNIKVDTGDCVCYLGQGRYSCGAGSACNPNVSPCQCATGLC